MSVALGFAPRSLPERLAVRPDLHRRALRGNYVSPVVHTSVRRWVGSKTNDDIVGQPLARTWLAVAPERITPDDIISSCPIPESGSILDHIPVLLVTPAFAHWVDTKSPLLQQWMNRLYHQFSDTPSEKPIHAVVSIVDRLPDGYSRDANVVGGRAMADAEGMSILFVEGENVHGKAIAPGQTRSVETQEPTLVFSFRQGITQSKVIRPPLHEIGLRLANTIFLNGKETTLIGTRWAYDPSLKELGLEKSVDLATCSVTVAAKHVHNSLELPLHPVGERRKVLSSMGNILRQIGKNADGKTDEPIAASSELEKDLPRYISEHNIVDQRISVWALIETSAESPYDKSRHSQSSLAKSIQMGSKLHRVVSGGGGWGKKHGLLSLDPEVSFKQPEEVDLLSLSDIFSTGSQPPKYGSTTPSEQRMLPEDLTTLSHAAEPGNYVQFFVSTEQAQPHDDYAINGHILGGSISCHFGVVSDAKTSSSQTTQHKELTVIPNYFGALSEKAITYLQPMTEASQYDTLGSQTKIDVPGALVALVLQ
ncbi:uncharacterized protein BJX67DRAFT_384472 [Aspergillus lucknowensis]|uniref:Uncharacterized protein n=1 Tax=Aspergillus lucknowensis TaxID=176173 RepID=A0ABR4LJM7_9EURO